MQQNFNESNENGPLAFLSTDLGIFRSISLLLSLLLPIYWFIANHDQSVMEALWSGKDPLGERLLLSTAFLLIFGFSWILEAIKKRAFLFTIGILYVLTGWSLHVLSLNEYAQDPLISTVIIAIVTSLLFRTTRQLFFYATFAMGGAVIAFLFSGAEPFRLIILLIVLTLTFTGIYFWLSQRINVRKSLARNEGLLHSILGFSSEFIFLVDGKNLKITNCNDRIPSFFPSASKESLIDKSLTEAIPEIFSETLANEVNTALSEDEDFEREIPLTENGGSVWVALSARKAPFEDQDLWMFRVSDITEAKRKEESLRFSDNILRNLDTLVLAANKKGEIIYLSGAVEKMLGYAKEKLMGNGWWELRKQSSKNLDSEKKYVIDCANGVRSTNPDLYENKIVAKDGTEKWILWKDTVTRDGTVIGIGQDISKNKKDQAMREVYFNIASASIQSSSLKDLYRYVHKEIAGAIPNNNFYISVLHHSGEKIHFPYYVDDPLGGTSQEFTRDFSDGISEYCITNHESLLLTGQDIRDMAEEGKISIHGEVPMVWMGVPLIFEGKAFGVLALQDYHNPKAYDEEDLNFLKLISNQIALVIRKKQSEEALKSSEAEFRGIFAQASVGIAKMSPDGSFDEINERLANIFGVSQAELKVENLFDLMLPDDVESSQLAFSEIMEGKTSALSIQKKYRHAQGSILHLHLYASLVQEGNDNPGHLIAVFDDVTELKRSEQEESLLREITLDIWSSEDSDTALSVTLEKTCKHLGWDFGEYWSYDSTENVCELGSAFYAPLEIHQHFFEESKKKFATMKQGLPNLAVKEKNWVWMEKPGESKDFSRSELAAFYCLQTALAIPLLVGDDVLGIFILYRSQLIEKDNRILSFTSRVATQLSSFILQKQAEEARQKAIIDASQENLLSVLQATFDSSPDGILIVDNQKGVINYNEKLKSMWKVSEEVLFSRFDEPAYTQILDQVKDPVRFMEGIEALEEHPNLPSYDIFEFKDGRILERFSRPFKQDAGKTSGRVWFFHDITDRTSAEKAVRENERKYRTLFSQANDAILLIQNEHFIDYNEKTISMFGASEDEIIGESIYKFSPTTQPDGQNSKELLQAKIQAAAGQKPQFFYWQHLRLDGVPFDTEVSMNHLEIDNQSFLQIMVRDISERMQAERALRDSEARNQAILNVIPDLMFILSKEGKVLDFKAKGEENLPMPQDEMIGASLNEFLPETVFDLAITNIQNALEGHDLVTFEYQLDLSPGIRHFEARLLPSGDDEVLAIIRNVTERKKAEIELIQRNFELDSFVYRASHDLKAPLNSIMGLIELLKMETEEPGLLSYLGLMDRSVTKLDSFIRNLTDFSRNERMEVETVEIDFEQMVQECIDNLSFMSNADRIKIQTDLGLNGSFHSDPVRILIVMNNLISNAIKYQDLKKENPIAKIEVRTNEKEAVIRIEDNGVGISQEHHDKIFNMFFRASYQSFGTGLGMYIVKNAVQKVGGEIDLSSELEVGTVFTVHIPNAKNTEIGPNTPS